MSDDIDAWFAAAGAREQELRRVDALVTRPRRASTGSSCRRVPARCSATG